MPLDSEKNEEERFSLKGVFQKGKEYADTKLELLKLVVIARASRIIARLLLDISRGIFGLLVLFFLSMALGFYLSDLLDNNALGFLATAGIFVFVIIMLSVFSTAIKRKIIDISIQKIFDDIDEEEEEALKDISSARAESTVKSDADLDVNMGADEINNKSQL